MLNPSLRVPKKAIEQIGRNVVTHIMTPLAIMYTVLYASEYVYYSQRCSRIDRIGTPICEYSHKLFVKTRSLIYTFIDNGLTTVGAIALSRFVNLSSNKNESSPQGVTRSVHAFGPSPTSVSVDPLGLPHFK